MGQSGLSVLPHATYRQGEPSLRAVWIASSVALIVCAVVRMSHLLGLPIFVDEMDYVRAGQVVANGQSLLAELHYGHPPLFSWMEGMVTHVTGLSPLLAGRLTSALTGVVTCLTAMLCAAEFALPWLVPLTGLAYALCPYAVMWDRMAILDGALSMWGALALFWTLRAHGARNNRQLTVRLILLGIAIGCGMYTKTEALAFNVLPILLALSGPRRRARIRVAALPIGTGLLMTASLLRLPESVNIVAAMHQHASHDNVLATIFGQVGAAGLWMLLYITPLGCAMGLYGLLQGWRSDPRWAIVGGYFVLPLVTFTLIPQTFFASRYLAFISVPGVLLIAFGLCRLQRLPWHVWKSCLAVFILWAGVQDARAVINPEQTVFVPFDRYTFVEGWPAGYGFSQAVSLLKGRARHQTVVIGCSIVNPPGDALLEEFWGWSQVSIVPFDLGDGKSVQRFIQTYPHGYIVVDLEGNDTPLVRLAPKNLSLVARYWKPGHRASYVVLQASPAGISA
jgi:hypothetical protein